MASAAVTAWKNRYEAARASSRRVRQKIGESTQALVNAGLSAGTGFALGAFAGSLKDPKDWEVAGVAIPVWVGGLAHAAALMGVGRGQEDHLRAIGTGALTVHAFGMGRKLIEAKKVSAKVSGELPSRSGSGITSAMLDSLTA